MTSLIAVLSTFTELVKRLRALTLKLLPVEVDPKELSNPTSRIISPHTIETYELAAGDFIEAVRAFLSDDATAYFFVTAALLLIASPEIFHVGRQS